MPVIGLERLDIEVLTIQIALGNSCVRNEVEVVHFQMIKCVRLVNALQTPLQATTYHKGKLTPLSIPPARIERDRLQITQLWRQWS